MKTIKLGFTLFILFIFQLSFAQKNYSDGYIITLANDTLHGKVRDKFVAFLIAQEKINFMDNDGNVTKYLAKDIKGYSKAGLLVYLTVPDNFGKKFAKLVVDGEVKLLILTKTGTNTASSPNGAGGFNHTQSSYSKDIYYLYESNTEKSTIVMRLDFKNQMANYFSDYEKLKNMILNKELRYNDLEVIVETYNKWKKEQISG
ncbi:MAG: hypothetical protein OEY34_04250 [Cyclobacteriaceae bacterium]|nr:hypothetical protein [Cyclobacteriaceae bacterium]